jgi:hypothetical protein
MLDTGKSQDLTPMMSSHNSVIINCRLTRTARVGFRPRIIQICTGFERGQLTDLVAKER